MPKKEQTIPSPEEFRTQLRRRGLRATRQRLAIHGAMMELVHASAEQVCARLEEQGARVTTASVYNILSQLADNHIYGRRLSSGSSMQFDVDPSRHFHMYDREHHVYRNLQDDQLAELAGTFLRRRRFKGYTIEDIDIQIITRPTRKTPKP